MSEGPQHPSKPIRTRPESPAETKVARMAIGNLNIVRTKTIKGPACAVCALLASLSDDEAAALRTLLSDKTVRYKSLAIALRDDPDTDIDIAPNTLSRHARGDCDARERLR